MMSKRWVRVLLSGVLIASTVVAIHGLKAASLASGRSTFASLGTSGVTLNRGQWDETVLAKVHVANLQGWITQSGVILQGIDRTGVAAVGGPTREIGSRKSAALSLGPHTAGMQTRDDAVEIQIPGAQFASASLVGREMLGRSNFLLGNDTTRWVRGVPVFREVELSNILPGIDLAIAVANGSIETRFVVGSAAETGRLKFALSAPAGSRMTTDHAGVNVTGGQGVFHLSNMSTVSAFDASTGKRSQNEALLTLAAAGAGLRTGQVVTNQITYSTFLGGTDFDAVYAVASDPQGAIYIAGNTESPGFPVKNAYDPSFNFGPFGDVFVTKLSNDGSSLVYSTFIGGTGAEILGGLSVDAAGNAYIAGITGSSTTFPLKGAYDSTYGGFGDAFVCKLSPTGDQLVYSTFLGGSAEDQARAIVVDGAGDAFITGHTKSTNFPILNALQGTYGGGDYDAFVTKLSAPGSALDYSTYLGGETSDQGFGIAVDQSGSAYVRGWTASIQFPLAQAFDSSFNGGERDVFISKLAPAGTSLVYSTYLGGTDSDYGIGISVDEFGSAYFGGVTRSEDFPLFSPLDNTIGGLQDLFVAKLSPAGTSFDFSTYLGGSAEDFNALVAFDDCGQVFVTGYTYSSDFPTVNALDGSYGGGADVVLAGLSADGQSLAFSTYLGGTDIEFPNGIIVIGSEICIAGLTNSQDFPSMGAYDSTWNGDYDAFVTRVTGAGGSPCGCACDCPADPAPIASCDGVRDILDVVQTINVAFRGAASILDPNGNCPVERTDVDCDDATGILDVVHMINVAFRGANPSTEFCKPCP